MSQRECAGFNWPHPTVKASNPLSPPPESTSSASFLNLLPYAAAARKIIYDQFVGKAKR